MATARVQTTNNEPGRFGAYGGRYVIECAVRMELDGSEVELGRATWADWDQRGRLIIAREGRILQWQLTCITEIADFNDQTPDPQPAASWATDWPDPKHV